MKENCPFCGIENTETRVINQGDLFVSFLSNPRLVEGHTLVIPKRHIEDPRLLTDQELLAIFAEIKRIETIMIDSGMADGSDIRQHFRPFLVQGRLKVDHVHFHILPRTFNDDLYQKVLIDEHTMFKTIDETEKSKMLALFY